VIARRYGRAPRRTYVTGISNGGHLTRWQLEHHPELYDGGVDREGTLWTADGPDLDAACDYAARPDAVRRAVARVSLTGRIGKPLITLQGDLDTLLPIAADSDVYTRMIREQGHGGLHRSYRIEDGTHVDGLYDSHPARLRPMLPCYRAAFDALVARVERGHRPPADRTVSRPASGDVVDSCSLRP